MKISLVKSILLSIVGAIGALISLILSLCISRGYGAGMAGLYYSVLGAVTFLSVFIALGDTKLLLKQVAIAQENDKYTSNLLACYQLSFIGRAIFIAGLTLVFSIVIERYYGKAYDHIYEIIGASLLLSLVQLYATYFNGHDRQLLASIFSNILLSLSLLGVLYVLYLMQGLKSDLVINWFLVSYFIAYLIVIITVRVPLISSLFNINMMIPDLNSLKISGTVLLNYFIVWSSTYMILFFGTQDDVGVFNTAIRLTLSAGIVNSVFSAMFSPKFAKEINQKKLQDGIVLNARLCFLFGGLSLVPILIFGDWFLGLFGKNFLAGTTALFVLSMAKLFGLIFGTSGQLLIMRGENSSLLISVGFGVIVQIISGLMLIPENPINGAAYSVLMGTVVEEICKFYYVYKRLGLISFVFSKT